MTRQKVLYILAILLLLFTSQAYAQLPYKSYCNTRFGFCVDYPATFGMGPAPTNNDGREFSDQDGFFMIASGMHNALDNSLIEEMKSQEEDFDKITYRVKKKNWFVLSGYKDNDILYLKTYIGKEYIYHLYIRYPTELKTEYNTLLSTISRSFKPGPLR